MQFERTKHAKIQMEESKAKFFGLINFLFTFRKAISNAECTGQQKSDSFTSKKLYAQSVRYIFIYLFIYFLFGLNLSKTKIRTTIPEMTKSKINETLHLF